MLKWKEAKPNIQKSFLKAIKVIFPDAKYLWNIPDEGCLFVTPSLRSKHKYPLATTSKSITESMLQTKWFIKLPE